MNLKNFKHTAIATISLLLFFETKSIAANQVNSSTPKPYCFKNVCIGQKAVDAYTYLSDGAGDVREIVGEIIGISIDFNGNATATIRYSDTRSSTNNVTYTKKYDFDALAFETDFPYSVFKVGTLVGQLSKAALEHHRGTINGIFVTLNGKVLALVANIELFSTSIKLVDIENLAVETKWPYGGFSIGQEALDLEKGVYKITHNFIAKDGTLYSFDYYNYLENAEDLLVTTKDPVNGYSVGQTIKLGTADYIINRIFKNAKGEAYAEATHDRWPSKLVDLKDLKYYSFPTRQ